LFKIRDELDALYRQVVELKKGELSGGDEGSASLDPWRLKCVYRLLPGERRVLELR